MRCFRVLAVLVLLASIGFSNTIRVPETRGGADCDQRLDWATEVEDTVPGGLSAGDWSGIQAAHEAGRYAAYGVEGGCQARNPGQRWLTTFDGRGFRTEPDSGGWSWGLELRSYGFAGNEQVVTEPTSVSAEGQRVAYAWGATLEEWYVNDSRGLEHGYIVHQRPVSDGMEGASPLTFTLAVRGGLRPVVDAAGRDVCFSNGAGGEILTYTGLSVVDAEGRGLVARFEHAGEGLRLSIDERGAHYPLTIDPIAQQAYFKASNTDADDLFGISVSISGDTVVVGAERESSNATGVNGDEADNSAWRSGAAYVFVRNGGNWSQQAYLKASNTGNQDWFGHSVSISGETIVVGASGEDSTSTGVNGGQLSNGAYASGAAYVFARNGTTWSQQAYLKASNTDPFDYFGIVVSVSDDTVVVGAGGESSSATGVNGNQADNSAYQAGAAYVFVRDGSVWSQQAYLKASNTDSGDGFAVVALSGDTLVVGATGESSGATGVNGDQGDSSAPHSGAAYVFVRSGRIWSQQAYLKASNTGADDAFGWGVSSSGDTIVVGAPREPSSATGVNGDHSDNSLYWAGAAYVFARNGASWSQQAYLKASNTDAFDQFGDSVSAFGNTVVIAAPVESSNATGINGDQSDNSASSAGAAYVFARSGTIWSQQLYLKASNTDAGDAFGDSVAISGDTLVVAAPTERSAAQGVNGDQGDNSAFKAGAAYAFEIGAPGVGHCFGDPASGTPCPCNNDNDGSLPGSGCANGVFASGAQLTGNGLASVTNDTLVLRTAYQEPSNSGLYFQGVTDLTPGITWGDGLRCTGGAITRLQVRFADGVGSSHTTIPIANKGGVSPGDTRYYQCWYRNPQNSPCGYQFNTSNGYVTTWIP